MGFRYFLFSGRLLASVLLLLATSHAVDASETVAPARPSQQIDLKAWGFEGFSPLARFASKANLTLDFIDAQHVLVTFNSKRMIVRHPDCPPSHVDRILQAVALDLATRQAAAQADWYVHDERPYLWPLGQGRFLLRRLNSLYVVDAGLREKLLLTSPAELLRTNVTPDGREILLETAATPANHSSSSDEPRVKIDFLDAGSLAVKNTLQATGAFDFEAADSGYADLTRSVTGKTWLIRFGDTPGQRKPLARVRSRCRPDLLFPSNQTLLIGRCSAKGVGYSVSVFALSGHPLWRERWSQFHHDPAVVHSEDGSRFAVSTVVPASDDLPANAQAEESYPWPEVEQEIRVYDTATGHPVLTARAQTAILKNRDFSLSPDGSRLAVADDTTLRVYDLPPESPAEREQFLAMAAGAPGLNAPVESADEDADLPPTAEEGEPVAAAMARPSTGASERAPVPPAGSAAPASPVGTFKAQAQEVIVDVVVTDGKGHPVKGLGQSAFRVEENGKPEAISYFHEFGSSASAPPAPAVPLEARDNFSNQVRARPDEPRVVLVLDFLNTPFADQQYAKQQLQKFLAKPAGTPLALCVLTERLQLLRDFTSDQNVLLADLGGKKGRIRFSSELEHHDDLNEVIQQEKQAAAQQAFVQGAVQQLTHAQNQDRALQLDRRMAITIDAFAGLARYLSGIPGRKSVVWLSGSLPAGFFGGASLNADTANVPPEVRSYAQQLRQATNLLAQAHIAVYPVDVRGFTVDSVFDNANNVDPIGAAPAGSQAQGPPGRPQPSPTAGRNTALNISSPTPMQEELEQGRDARAMGRASMDQVAEETGGRAFYGNRVQQAIAAAVEQSSDYYLMSYVPGDSRHDGEFRKIKVALAGKGYHLAYRHGYYALDAGARTEENAAYAHGIGNDAMQYGAPQSHQLVFAVQIHPVGKPLKVAASSLPGAAVEGKKAGALEVQRYSIDYAVSAAQVHFTMNGEMHHAVLDFLLAAFNEHGASLARVTLQSNVDLKPEGYRDATLAGLRLHQEIEIPVAASALRLGVEDELNPRVGTLELPLPLAPSDEPREQARKPAFEPD